MSLWCFVDEAVVVEDEAIANSDDTIGVRGDVWVVRHEDDREPVFSVKLPEETQDLLTGLRVEVARRLIGNQK